MKKEFRIQESDLLREDHFPVKALFNMVADSRFVETVEALSNNSGFGENYGACNFWNDLDDYDKEHTPFYEGAEFGLHNGEDIIVGYKEILYYLEVACAGYCEDHPEDTAIILQYIEDYKTRNGLK